MSIALTEGGYLIADQDASRIREVTGTTITTAAGTETTGFSGDGGDATLAELNAPVSVAVTADGGFLIADVANNRVRQVTPGGIIDTVAGNGETTGDIGDGGPATGAELSFPLGVAVTADGGFVISDALNARVRRVTGGTISTVAGNGTPGFDGDGGPATAAQLGLPYGLAVTANGGLLIADNSNHRVRRVEGAAAPDPGPGPGPGPGVTPTPAAGGSAAARAASTGSSSTPTTPFNDAPLITGAAVTNSVFAVNRPGAAARPGGPRRGTAFRFTLSEAAKVTFSVHRSTIGRRVAGACRATTPANRGRGRCTLNVPVGSFAKDRPAGLSRVAFAGILRVGARNRVLSPATYRVTLIARDAGGQSSAPKRVTFRVVR